MNSPIRKENSIDSNTFVLVFERPFSKQELQCLLRLQSALEAELPSFKEINSINVRLEGEKVTPSQEITGVLLQCFKPDGKPSIELKVEGNIIEITFFTYDRWNTVWQKAKQFLLEAIKALDNETNKLVIYVLKVVDKFLYEGDAKDYSILDTFSESAPYLTKNIYTNKVRIWHIFQGWFDDLLEKPEVVLNNLNINTSDVNGKTLTTIEHDIRHQFKHPQTISDKSEMLDDIFFSLHEKNKIVIKALLNEEQKEKIGI
jgi:uncharacterized protein (TIGR04255 family)